MRSTLFVFLLSYSLSVLASSNLSVFEHTGKKHELSREQLLQLPQTEITTALPWSEGESVYGGVTLQVVLEALELSMPPLVTIVALNDYKVAIPKEDFCDHQPIIAVKRNGQFMPVREKGPYWLIYPLSSKPEINNTDFHAKMIWQIRDIRL